ncbi:MAG TPA: tetratricopeptide repeat protein [Gaiellaceae bacterium]|nr:tetratricopeptide repeat protein [Gaiellaceae bacterium]
MPRKASTHVDDPLAVGQRIRSAREATGLSQRALSFPGCTTAYISRIEAGTRTPSLQILAEIGRRLNLSATFLATGEDDADQAYDPIVEADLDLRLTDSLDARARLEELAGGDTDPRTRARALARLGHLALDAGSHEEAIELLESALRVWPALDEEEPQVADSLGRAYALTSRYEEALAIFERRLQAAEERNDFVDTIRFSVLYANTLTDRGRFGHAEEVIGHALALADQSRDPVVRARLWWTQARLHTLQNNPVGAERYARLALAATELTEHLRYSAAVYQMLALLKNDQNDPEAALELLDQGTPLMDEGGNAFQQGLFLTERARALVGLGRLDEAEECSREALERFVGASPGDAARVLAILAEIRLARGDLEGAIEAYREAAEAAPVGARYKVESYSRLADLLRSADRTDEALDVLTAAVALQSDAVRD